MRGVGDRERERRAEGVERPDEVHVSGEEHEDRRDPGEQDEREPRRLEPRVQAAQRLGQLAVARHRVRDPRRADHPRVRRDEEDGRGQQPDVDLGEVVHEPLEPEVLDDAEDGVVRVPALLRGERQQRRQLPVDLLDGQRGERDEREREVDREHRPGDELVRGRDRAHRVAGLLGEVGDGLDAGVREHRDRDRDREVRPRRRDAPVDVLDERLGAEDEREADDDEQELRREVDHRERDREPRRLLHADDVQRDEHDDHDRAAHDVPRVLVQRLPEDRQVVRDEERRDRDRDDVDEHLRPARDEARELVERVAREARRAARLGEARRALRVGRRGRGEDDPGDDEDERRQAERVERGQAERVVDRGADVAVGGREERGRAEDALELDLAPAVAAPGHARNLQRRGAGVRRPLVGRADRSLRRLQQQSLGGLGRATAVSASPIAVRDEHEPELGRVARERPEVVNAQSVRVVRVARYVLRRCRRTARRAASRSALRRDRPGLRGRSPARTTVMSTFVVEYVRRGHADLLAADEQHRVPRVHRVLGEEERRRQRPSRGSEPRRAGGRRRAC